MSVNGNARGENVEGKSKAEKEALEANRRLGYLDLWSSVEESTIQQASRRGARSTSERTAFKW